MVDDPNVATCRVVDMQLQAYPSTEQESTRLLALANREADRVRKKNLRNEKATFTPSLLLLFFCFRARHTSLDIL